MEVNQTSVPISLTNITVTDSFFKKKMELVRKEVIPYQWEALNDRVKDASPSFCMHNYKAAGRLLRKIREDKSFIPSQNPNYGFAVFPKEGEEPEEDKFYGFLFQDSDFYKWIEAVGYSLSQHPDPELENIADEAIDIVCAAQADNGYLDTYYILNGMDYIFSNLRDNHELYCFGHLLEGAIAYYQATGKDKLLKTAMAYGDFIAKNFGPEENKLKGYPGHEVAEMALAKLYEVTGNTTYLDLSQFFLNQRGTKPYYFDIEEEKRALRDGIPYRKPHPDEERHFYHQANRPVKELEEAAGHAVRAVYLYSGMADVARLTGDEKMAAACKRLWRSIVDQKLYITGGIGATHMGEAFSFPYDLPNDTAYSETCAAIGLVFFARRMLQLEPNSEYGDVAELALYNTVLSGMALDGKSFFYVNPLEVLPEACHRDERKFHVKPIRQKWFGCACCPPNIARILSSVGSYSYTENETTIYTHLYIGGAVTKKIGSEQITMQLTSGFPYNGKITVDIDSSIQDMPVTLAFRIPGWAKSYQLEAPEDCVKEVKNGYLYLTKVWGRELLALDFPMSAQWIMSNPMVVENTNKLALKRGPLVYAMEEVDNGKHLHLLTVDPDSVVEEHWRDIEGEQYLELMAQGYRKGETKEAMSLYQEYKKPSESSEESSQKVTIRFLPYYLWCNRGENEMTVWVPMR